ncbi:YceI family protein [Marinobacter nanhaiticus D15-8W]|uniref:Polyisoprenoid-binding protein n=1 Tax=Marinobacter nanhaiticus D15-8W TaxID=626887 RepID=N6VVX2_9GAMM|nr:YceI family protein [Marinobacter nanhaiticus]ENO14340.1 polyisoprenoid-binding protein [Marinobacter nanhaiticus D15-8W]BES71728.1 YceI family protein [Marinobacter nanhaiticus D15-8W]
MQRLVSTTCALSLATLLAAPLHAEPTEFTIDPEHFAISFAVNHLGYASVLGFFTEAEGSFVYDEAAGSFGEGRVVVQSDSVFTDNEDRDDHLRSDDFLNAAEYPEIVFEFKDFTRNSDKQGVLTGDLTMLGQTHSVSLDVTLNKMADYPFGHGDYTLGMSATTTVERSRWGMDYGLDMVGDEVHLRFELEATAD